MAITSWPTCKVEESPKATGDKPEASARMTAMSVSGSSPMMRASWRAPSEKTTWIWLASWTTWLLVTMKPSGVMTKPEPLPWAGFPAPLGRF